MRVLHLVHSRQRRGAEIFCHDLSAELRRQGHEVRIVYLYRHLGEAALPLGAGDIELGESAGSRLELWLAHQPRVLQRVREAVERFDPQVVQVNGSRTVKYGALAARRDRARRWALVYRSIGNPEDWVRTSLHRWFYARFVMPSIDGVVSVSDQTSASLARLYALRIPRVTIPRGVDVQRMAGRTDERPREQLGTPPDAPVVVYVGALSPEKRLDRWLRVAARVGSANPEARFWIVGEGQEEKAVRALATEMGIADRVRLLGVRSDLPALLQAATVLLLTSDSEGTPGVLLEAQAAGTPVVATRVGGVAGCVFPGASVRVVERDDEAALARAVTEVLRGDSGTEADRMAQAWVRDRFSIGSVAVRYLKFYERVLAARST